MWKSSTKGIEFPFTGVPFLIAGRKLYVCHYGKDLDACAKDSRKKKKLETQALVSLLHYHQCLIMPNLSLIRVLHLSLPEYLAG